MQENGNGRKSMLVIGDPTSELIPHWDTGLSLSREALKRGFPVFWAVSEDLFLWKNELRVRACGIKECLEDQLPELYPKEVFRADDFSIILIRKNPPFNSSYLTLCWLLAIIEDKVRISNPSSVLLRYHEKLLPHEACRSGFVKHDELIPTLIAQPPFLAFRAPFLDSVVNGMMAKDEQAEEWVSKPFLGFGGGGVQRWKNLACALDESQQGQGEAMLFQPLMHEIAHRGDRRAFFIGGDLKWHFVRLPPPHSIKANVAQGGTMVLRPLPAAEEDLCFRIGQFLKSLRVDLAGVDILAGKLSEINITSPTGFQAHKKLVGPNLNPVFLDYLSGSC